MKLLVIRHAIAEDRDEFAYTGRPDAERPLTKQGRERMRRAAAGLAAEAPRIDVQHILGEYRKHMEEAHGESGVQQRRREGFGENFVAAYVTQAVGEVVEQTAM